MTHLHVRAGEEEARGAVAVTHLHVGAGEEEAGGAVVVM